MKQSTVTVFALYVLSCLAVPAAGTGDDSVLTRSAYEVLILQDGRELPVAGGELRLKKAPFAIVFLFSASGERTALLNISAQETHYRECLEGEPLSGLPEEDWGGRGMAESDFNIDKELMIDPASFNVWYHEGPADHRFNEAVRLEDGRWRCRRDIERFLDLQADPAAACSVTDYPSDSLYIVFLHWKPVAGMPEYHPACYRRLPLRIMFEG